MADTIEKLVFIPAPRIDHIMYIIGIAKLIVNLDQRLSVTVLIIKPPGSSPGSAITTYIESLAKNSMDRISFIELPQEEVPLTSDSKGVLASVGEFINSHCKYVRSITADMTRKSGSYRVAGFVVDLFCTCMIDVANEFNVPTYVVLTTNVAILGFNLYIQKLCDDEHVDVIQLSHTDTEIQVPTFVKPVPTKVFPTAVHNREILDFLLSSTRRLREVKGIVVNSFMELETHAIKSLSEDNTIPPLYLIGPMLNLKGDFGTRKPSGDVSDDDIVRWLDDQLSSSVVFLCFGRMGSFDVFQVKEIARALERSGHRFLCSLSQSTNDQGLGVVLPEGFLERTKGIGKVIGWAPQAAVLAHPAVGGFVSHCGWNSLLESLWYGVPVAAWPMYAEQQINAFEMVVELGLAVEIKLDYKKNLFNPIAETVMVTAEEIEGGIRRVMEDDLVRTKVKSMSKKSRLTMVEGGSSYESIGSLIQELIKNVS